MTAYSFRMPTGSNLDIPGFNLGGPIYGVPTSTPSAPVKQTRPMPVRQTRPAHAQAAFKGPAVHTGPVPASVRPSKPAVEIKPAPVSRPVRRPSKKMSRQRRRVRRSSSRRRAARAAAIRRKKLEEIRKLAESAMDDDDEDMDEESFGMSRGYRNNNIGGNVQRHMNPYSSNFAQPIQQQSYSGFANNNANCTTQYL